MLLALRALALAALLGVAFLVGLIFWPIGRAEEPITMAGDVARGDYLLDIGGCVACHSGAEGGVRMGGGKPMVTEFGTFRPPDLTRMAMDVDSFGVAVRQGVSPEGKPYYPAFPYPFYGTLTDQDIADMWAAIEAAPDAKGDVPAHALAFPYNLRFGLKLWRAAYLTTPETDPDPIMEWDWNRGRELVEGIAHCGACHTGRNFAGARMASAKFAGAKGLPGGESAPSIRKEDLEADGWTVDDLAFGLSFGITPLGDVLGGSMSEVIEMGTGRMTPEDRTAIATYLLGLPFE